MAQWVRQRQSEESRIIPMFGLRMESDFLREMFLCKTVNAGLNRCVKGMPAAMEVYVSSRTLGTRSKLRGEIWTE